MASGSIGISTSNQYIVGAINWQSTPNTDGNYSDVYCELRAWRTNTGYTTSGTCYWRLNAWGGSYSGISANTTNGNGQTSLTYNSNTFLASWSFRVYHNADGTANVAIGISSDTGIDGTSWTSSSGAGTAYLDTIPRASQPSLSAGSIALGSAVTINTNRVAGFTHNIFYSFSTTTKVSIATGVTDNTTWTVPNSFANSMPSVTSSWGTIYCDTYNGGTFLGTKTVTFTVTVPNTVTFQPTIGAVTNAETITAVSTLALGAGRYVQSMSNVRFTMSGIAGAYTSTVSLAKITFNGTTYNATVTNGTATWDTGVLAVSGTLNYSVTVTDSRGYTDATPITGSITMLPYASPLISALSAKRCDVNGNVDEIGTYLMITRNGSASSIKNASSVEKNVTACTVAWSPKGANSWTNMTEYTKASSSVLVTTAVLKSTKSDFSITSAYDIRFSLSDVFRNTVSIVIVSVGTVMMSWSQNGVGIGKVWGQGSLDVGGDAFVDGSISGANADLALKSQLVGDYKIKTTANKMIWTIGTDWNSWGNHYGLGYEYGSIGGSTDHQLTFRGGGVTHARIGLVTGNAIFSKLELSGRITSSSDIYLNNTGASARLYFAKGTGTNGIYDDQATSYLRLMDINSCMQITNPNTIYSNCNAFIVRGTDNVERFRVSSAGISAGGFGVWTGYNGVDNPIDVTTYLQLSTARGLNYGVTWWQSDVKLKENIVDNQQDSLSKIMQIQHKEFDYKNGTHVTMGYIAQDLQAIDEELVFAVTQEDNTEVLQPAEQILIPHITRAIQQLYEEIRLLKGGI